MTEISNRSSYRLLHTQSSYDECPLRRRSGHADGNRRCVGGGRFHSTGRLPFADERRGIASRTAIRHDQHFIFATADRAISRRQTAIANDADGRAGRPLETLLTWWPGRTLRSWHPRRTGVPLGTRRTARAGITLGALATTGEAEGQSSYNNKMRCPHDVRLLFGRRHARCRLRALPPGGELSEVNSVPSQRDSEQSSWALGLIQIMIRPPDRRNGCKRREDAYASRPNITPSAAAGTERVVRRLGDAKERFECVYLPSTLQNGKLRPRSSAPACYSAAYRGSRWRQNRVQATPRPRAQRPPVPQSLVPCPPILQCRIFLTRRRIFILTSAMPARISGRASPAPVRMSRRISMRITMPSPRTTILLRVAPDTTL